MTIGIKTGSVITEVGPGAILHALFSSVSGNLEPAGWGTRFPMLLNRLYQGLLDPSDAASAMAELNIVRAELSKLSVAKVIWDIEAPTSVAPSEFRPNPAASSLGNYFFTTTGRDLLAELVDSVESAIEFGDSVKVISYSSPLEFFDK